MRGVEAAEDGEGWQGIGGMRYRHATTDGYSFTFALQVSCAFNCATK